ncbi:F-box domain containing protein [Trema orientale]|uniref:F-box domain containing protein n=1 Tax=Trema orientale TaxID=63057 RepID=A0A2P5C1E8_TREOI|nr:F-box domain containing protein [Trema orientale]
MKMRMKRKRGQLRERWSESEKAKAAAAEEEEAAAASKFTSTITDDLLFEILIRLPNPRSLIQCGAVCKRWFSLVSRSEYFIRTFNHHHRHQRRRRRQIKSPNSRGAYCTYSGLPAVHYLKRHKCYEFFSEESRILHRGHNGQQQQQPSPPGGGGGGGYLDFLGSWVEEGFPFIRSSFHDLLLVDRTRKDFYICNPLTRQCVALPEAPTYPEAADRIYRSGFACEAKCDESHNSYDHYCNCSVKYSVVVVSTDDYELEYRGSIFSSETGEWSTSTFQFPVRLYIWHCTPVGCGGIIYWPYGPSDFRGIVAFDPSSSMDDSASERCRLIDLPPEFGRDWRTLCSRARLGAVQGRLRLSQFFWHKRVGHYVLKAWDLDGASSWLLVRHVRLKWSTPGVYWRPVALHPDDGDVFFLSRTRRTDEDLDICQYRIGEGLDDCEFLCRYPHLRNLSSPSVVTLVHPWWPTKIPELPELS